MRAKKALMNTTWNFLREAVQIVCAFILPRLILTSFGSQYVAVTGAISQIMGVVALLQAGIGGVTQAALYKPLAENNVEQISIVVKATEKYLRKVALIFVGFSVGLACVYPFLVSNEFDWVFTASLVMIMCISTFVQYFFGQTYRFLLNADQNQRILSIIGIAKIVINTLVSVLMINAGFGIRAVKLGSAIIYVIAPLFIYGYAKTKYNIQKNVNYDDSVIKQRWDNFGQQIAEFITMNTDLIVLSLFSNIYEVSVYIVYKLVFNGVKALFFPLVNGVGAAFGNMIAREETDIIEKNLKIYEHVVFSATTILFSVALKMTIPFVLLYTKNVDDVNYLRPTFMYILVHANMFKCFMHPYQSIANAAGHFRQTRNSAFVEAAINIILSVTLVFNLGIVGVAIGTLVAYAFRTIRFAMYLSRNLVRRSIWTFVKRLILSYACHVLVFAILSIVPFAEATNYYIWIFNAAVAFVIAMTLTVVVEVLFYRGDIKELLKILKRLLKRQWH